MSVAQTFEYKISREALAAILVATAMASSSVVFSEPAVADVLMFGVICGLPVLGMATLGSVGATNLAMWLIIVATGLIGTTMSISFVSSVIHQIVTLYLALSAVAVGAYIARDPIPRFELVMRFYTLACIIATTAAIVGYFDIVPGTSETFTKYGRARGTFKDPNVLGAAVIPALSYTIWNVFRAPMKTAIIAAGVTLFLLIGILISFSRGAWMGAFLVSIAIAWLALISTRKNKDVIRYLVVTVLGLVAVAFAITSILQLDSVKTLFEARANLEQSYDLGPDGRFGGQNKAINLILDNPFGIGTKNFAKIHHHEQAHNVYLTMFLYAGWLGGVLYIASVAMSMFVTLLGALKPSPLQSAFIVTATALAVTALMGFLVDSDHWRHFFIVMGLSWGLADAARSEHPKFLRSHHA